jgi:hypothetical protein
LSQLLKSFTAHRLACLPLLRGVTGWHGQYFNHAKGI